MNPDAAPAAALATAPRWWTVVHLVLWQGLWWLAVLAAAHDRPWLGAVAALVLIAGHAIAMRDRMAMLAVWAGAMLAAGLGLLIDTGLGAVGAIRMTGGAAGGQVAPLWMAGLWAAMATALPGSLAWLRPRPWLMLAFGVIGGPAAYAGGVALGALSWGPLGAAGGLAAIALGYAVAMPLLHRIDRFAHARAQGAP